MRFGKPLDFSRYEGMENDRYILRAITDEIMYEIMQLSGQEYVDLYATQGQGARPRSRRPTPSAPSARPATSSPTTPASRSRRPDPGACRVPARPTEPAAIAVEDRMYRWLAVLRFVLVVNAVALNVYRATASPTPWAPPACWPAWSSGRFVISWAYHSYSRRTTGWVVADLVVALRRGRPDRGASRSPATTRRSRASG